MSFIEHFRQLPAEKKKSQGQRLDSNSTYASIMLEHLPQELGAHLKNSEIIVRPSVGKGNYADIPWICLLSNNLNISPSPQKGIYIVLLFNKTGDSFYLTLNQGITNFNDMRLGAKRKREFIERTVMYFQNELKNSLLDHHKFITTPIDLGENVSSLAKGYIQTTIVSKKYEVSSFDEEDFYASLSDLLFEYNEIIDHIGDKTYDDVIELINPIEGIESVDEALEEINNVLRESFIENRDVKKTLVKVEKGKLRTNKYSRLVGERISKKTDYIKQAKETLQIGLKGEELALEIERNRVLNLSLNPDEYVKWCSVESDSYGYDIESVDYKDGNLVKIYIEVKSSKGIKDTPFFVSTNEVEVSKRKKEAYRVFRIFDITSIMPKYYIADGEIEENFYLDPVTFSARYKYEVVST
jgi:Domain of unknown function (DUF3578).